MTVSRGERVGSNAEGNFVRLGLKPGFGSEPGLTAIVAVFVAKFIFQDFGFGAGAKDLHGNHDEEDE